MIGAAGGALVSSAVFLVGLLAARSGRGRNGPGRRSVGFAPGGPGGGWLSWPGGSRPSTDDSTGPMTGLAMAAVVLIISVLGGSPAPTGQVALLAAIAIVVGGISGWLGGRRRYNGGSEPTG